MRRAVCCALVIGALLPAAADARVLRAETILPPGQSGHVSIPGLADGTGSPHLYDQLDPFIRFRWKNAMFHQGGREERPRPGVRIVRDGFGVPAVYGDTEYLMWWGAGYALAQDRMFEFDLFRLATTGRLSEITGTAYLEDDRIVRQDFYTPSELDSQLALLPQRFRDRIAAYRDGVNGHIQYLRDHPSEMPGEYAATGLPLTDWTSRDTAAIGVYLARTIPSNADPHGLELANMRALQLAGRRALDALVPLRTPGQLTTVPWRDARFPAQPGRRPRDEETGFQRSLRFVRNLPFPTGATSPQARPSVRTQLLGRPGGSYMFAARRSDGHAFLYNGPQLGFTAPERIVELELHGPGIEVRGLTAPGVPVIGAGHNPYIAWGITTGASDTDDLYAEELVPGQPEQYRFRGRTLQMNCRNETLNYGTTAADVIARRPPERGTRVERVCRTIHGPVQERAGNVAYARRYAQWGRELESLEGLADINVARSVQDVDRAVRKFTWNENVMAIDSGGNIGFWHPGLYPQKPRKWDERLPMPGNGDAEWRGVLDRRRMPYVINPRQGWLANWNNLPADGWTAGDGTARKRMDGRFFRVHLLNMLVGRFARNPTFEGVRQVIRQAGTIAQQRYAAEPHIRRALTHGGGASGGAAVVLRTLLNWGGSYHDTDSENTVDPGVATWDAFRAEVANRAVAPFGSGAQFLSDENSLRGLHGTYHEAAGYHYFDASHFESFGLRTLGPDGYRAAAASAYTKLVQRFGSTDPARWREPRRMYDFQGLAGAQPPPLPFFDRGTFEQLIETGP